MSKNIVIVSLAIASIVGCAKGGDTTAGHDFDPKVLNMDIGNLSPHGCLDLQLLREKMSKFPKEARTRFYSTSYKMEPLNNSDGVRRAFVSLSAFSNYTYKDAPIAQTMDEMPKISQAQCDSVTLSTRLEGAKTYRILKSKKKSVLMIESDDGISMEWNLTDQRGLETTIRGAVMDPCPQYLKALATSTQRLEWGSVDDLSKSPVHISREYLKLISTAVVDMPEGLMNIASYDSEDRLMKASSVELESLKHATLDPKIYQCPYRANPPSGDEPPSPTENINETSGSGDPQMSPG